VFENNVRFNHKRTEFEKGTIRVLINFGGGKLSVPADKPGLLPFAQSTFQLGGLEKHGVDDIRRIFASRTVGSDFTVGDEAFLLSPAAPRLPTSKRSFNCSPLISPPQAIATRPHVSLRRTSTRSTPSFSTPPKAS
jgi:hypothetical protein